MFLNLSATRTAGASAQARLGRTDALITRPSYDPTTLAACFRPVDAPEDSSFALPMRHRLVFLVCALSRSRGARSPGSSTPKMAANARTSLSNDLECTRREATSMLRVSLS